MYKRKKKWKKKRIIKFQVCLINKKNSKKIILGWITLTNICLVTKEDQLANAHIALK